LDDGALVAADRLVKRYGERSAVAGVDLAVRRGDVYAVLGPNGAGKSTLLRLLLGLVRPTEGHVRLFGHDPWRHPELALRRVGAVVEAPNFFPYMTAWDNLRLLGELSGGVPAERLRATLAMVGLADRARDPVRRYSHGMRQRLGIAAALLASPELLVLDEPTDGLDPVGVREVRRLIRRLGSEGRVTVLLSSHLLSEVQQVATRVAILSAGRVVAEGAVADLLAADGVVEWEVDDADRAAAVLAERSDLAVTAASGRRLVTRGGPAQVAAANRSLVAAGVEVFAIRPRETTLEEVFFALLDLPPAGHPGEGDRGEGDGTRWQP
jgi:ABC-2 type transport system ATP-binding protein